MRLHRFLATMALSMLGIAGGHEAWDDWVDRTDLPPVLAQVSVEVLDRNGALLRAFPVEDGRIRLRVSLEGVDPDFADMLIAYEDKRFYRHNGVDGIAVMRAAAQAIRVGEVVSGASTLTMQTARLIENGGTGNLRGKLRQMRVAWALERRLSKAQILQLYLQHAPYGGRIEGVRSASYLWFGKEPARLSPAEAALLVALPPAPEARRPDRHPNRAAAARDRVLERLNMPPVTASVPRSMRAVPRLAPHLADHLRARDPLAERHVTTIGRDLQFRLEGLVRTHTRSRPDGTSAALIVADHQSGEILARVGAPHYADENGSRGFVDMTRAKRSPGSTLKPLIYAIAFDRGLAHPETVLADVPTRFGRYAPQNFDGRFRGDVSARHALSLSLNIPPVALLDAFGPARLVASLDAFGARPDIPGDVPGLAVALGGVGLSLEDLVRLYAGLAQLGHPVDLTTGPKPAVQRAAILAPRSAWQVGDILQDTPPPAGHRAGLAYKTGTSYGHRDAWAIGYDGQHVIGVWLGRADGTPVPGIFGGAHAAPLLFEAFGALKPAFAPLPPPPADTLMVSNGDLPVPLRRFGGSVSDAATLALSFPPDGAVIMGASPVLKLAGGTAPFSVLVNGNPVIQGVRQREIAVPAVGAGFSRIAVVDAKGRSAAVEVELRP